MQEKTVMFQQERDKSHVVTETNGKLCPREGGSTFTLQRLMLKPAGEMA